MTAPHRIEQHDGRTWRLVGWALSLRFFRDVLEGDPEKPLRLVEADSRRIVALHDPRRGYAFPETAT